MRGQLDLEHGVELAERSDQIGDHHECLHVVCLVRLLEVTQQVHEGKRLPLWQQLDQICLHQAILVAFIEYVGQLGQFLSVALVEMVGRAEIIHHSEGRFLVNLLHECCQVFSFAEEALDD